MLHELDNPTVRDVIEALRQYDPEAPFLMVCAMQKNGRLAYAPKCRIVGAGEDSFDGLDDQGCASFVEQEQVYMVPADGPWAQKGEADSDEDSPSV